MPTISDLVSSDHSTLSGQEEASQESLLLPHESIGAEEYYEDVDLGVRLWRIGPLAYAPQAQVVHVTEPHLGAFVRRFIRYGRASRLLSARYQVELSPRRFAPQRRTALDRVLADLQFFALWWGYVTTKPGRSWSVPPVEIPWCVERE